MERSLPVTAEAVVTLCVASGTLTVRGWDKNEIRVRSLDATQLDFRRIDKIKDTPASRVDVMVLNKSTGVNPKLDCQAIADVEMEVPAGATVQARSGSCSTPAPGIRCEQRNRAPRMRQHQLQNRWLKRQNLASTLSFRGRIIAAYQRLSTRNHLTAVPQRVEW